MADIKVTGIPSLPNFPGRNTIELLSYERIRRARVGVYTNKYANDSENWIISVLYSIATKWVSRHTFIFTQGESWRNSG